MESLKALNLRMEVPYIEILVISAGIRPRDELAKANG